MTIRSLGLWSLPFLSTLSATCFWDARQSSLPIVGGVAWACAFLIGIAVLRRNGGLKGLLESAWPSAAIASLGTLALPAVEWAELQGYDFRALGSPIAWMATVFGASVEAVDGRLLINQGRLDRIPLGAAQVGLAPAALFLLAAWSTMLAVGQRRPWRMGMQLMAGVSLWMVLRVAVTIGATSRIGQSMLSVGDDGRWFIVRFLVDAVWTTLTLAPLVVLLASMKPMGRREDTLEARFPRAQRMALAGLLVLLSVPWVQGTLTSKSAAPSEAGLKVLVDDYKSAEWSSASKPLNRESATRDSVYGYSALVSYLGRWHEVSVNRTEAYTPGLLDDVDVLVLKPALRRFDPAEVKAIRNFVESGGGLWVLGDHTDLLGSSTALNEVIQGFGIELQKDACNQLSDGRTHHWRRSPWDGHWITRGLTRLDFLTSCSLKLGDGAKPVLVSGDAFSDPVDYSGESFFGDVRPDLSDEVGPIVVAASTERGKGRVVVFGDSTIFSSFCLTYGETERFALRCLAWLGRAGPSGRVGGLGTLLWLSAQLLLFAAALVWRLDWPLAVTVGASALWITTLLDPAAPGAKGEHATGSAPAMVFVEDLGDYDLPVPVLDYTGDDRKAFDTCFTWVHRLSAVPDVRPLDELQSSDVGVLVRPSNVEMASGWGAFQAHLHDGGVLVVLGGEDPREAWARRAGAGAEAWGLRSHPLGLKAKAYTALGGTLLWVEDADLLSRKDLGTSFDEHRPGTRAWRRNEWCLDLWEWVLQVAHTEGSTKPAYGPGSKGKSVEASAPTGAS